MNRPLRALALATLAASSLLAQTVARAQDKITFMTSWYAQAEHGGFYQALAEGLYRKEGLDVTVKMGGPQVNGMQLLLAGQADFIMSYDLAVLSAVEKGFPVITVAASFQKDLQGMLTHDDVSGLDGLKDKTILVATSGRTTWWPWLKAKYGYTDGQSKPYTFNLQPFFADTNVVQQAYPSSEPFQAQQRGVPTKFFLFADDGYPPYGTTIVTTQALLKAKPDVVKRFVEASMKGWVSYLKDPAPANALIKKDNPNMTDAQIAFGISQLKALKVLDSGDAAKSGVGTMTEARWKATRDYMVKEGLLKADTPWQQAFTLDIVRQIKVMP
jgi:NitT/TauT family transport system substrate-binding protein